MKRPDLILKYSPLLKIKSDGALISLSLGTISEVLPLFKFSLLGKLESGIALESELLAANRGLLLRLARQRFLIIEGLYEGTLFWITPKNVQALERISRGVAANDISGNLSLGERLRLESPLGDCTLEFDSNDLSAFSKLKQELPYLFPDEMPWVGEEHVFLEPADLNFLGSVSFGSSSEKIGGLFLSRPLGSESGGHSNKQTGASLPDIGDTDLTRLYLKRQSYRNYVNEALPSQGILTLLSRLSCFKENSQGRKRKLYPNGGAIYENDFYLVNLNFDGLEQDVHWLDQEKKVLRPLEKGSELDFVRERGLPHSWTNHPHGYIIITAAIFKRMRKYKGIALKHALVNAGVIVDFIYANCVDLSLDCCAHGSWSGNPIFSQLIERDFFGSPIVAVVGVGKALKDD